MTKGLSETQTEPSVESSAVVEIRKLKPGPGLSADRVEADQQRRLHRAMIDLIGERGWPGVKVRALTRAAGISTATFYKHFANADACLASTYRSVMAQTMAQSTEAQTLHSDWRESLHATVRTTLTTFAAEPRVARVALVEIFGAGPVSRQQIGLSIVDVEQLITAAFSRGLHRPRIPRRLVAGLTAGMLRVARKTVLVERSQDLPAITPHALYWMFALARPEILDLPATSPEARGRQREPQPFPQPDRSAKFESASRSDDRGRLLRATIKLAEQNGLAHLTAPAVRTEAAVSRQSFQAIFDDLEECFLDSVEMLVRDATEQARAWSSEAESWDRRTCRLLLALCAQAARNRRKAQLVFQEILIPGTPGLVRREKFIEIAATALRRTVPLEDRPPLLSVEASVSAAWRIAEIEVIAGRARQMPALAALISYIMLAPILGAEEAMKAILMEFGSVETNEVSP